MKNPSFRMLGSATVALTLATGAAFAPQALGSSHNEAPYTSAHPNHDDTDFYMFVDPNDATKLVLIANRYGLIEPQGGPNYAKFDDAAYYDVNIDNDGDAIADVVYRFTFKSSVARPETFIYADGPVTSIDSASLNVKQTYTLKKRTRNGDGSYTSTTILEDQPVLPPNIGTKTFPSGYKNLLNGVQTTNGTKVFVGPRQDPFFVDLGMTFDLVNLEVAGAPVASPGRPGVGVGATGGGRDTLYGFTVLSTTLSVPITDVIKGGAIVADAQDPKAIVGAWASISVPKTSTLNADGTTTYGTDYVQVSRLGNPLVNEVLVGLGKKNAWNASTPDQESAFKDSELRPILATYMNVLFGLTVPPNTSDRGDIEIALFRGIPASVATALGVKPTQRTNEVYSDQLRLNTAVAPTAFASASRLGYLGGDGAGFPNGRRPCDDVVDIELRVVAGVLVGPPYNAAPNTLLGDGVDYPERGCRFDFPFMWSPTGGFDAVHASGPYPTHAAQVRAGARRSAPEKGFVRGSENDEFEPLTKTSRSSVD